MKPGHNVRALSKYDRALARLRAGQPLYQLPDGSYKFGGNKYIPQAVATRLPISQQYIDNRGWVVFSLDIEASNARRH